MVPQLARVYGPRYSTFPCYCQPKLNGVRALYQNGTFQSRDEIQWNEPVLRHLSDELTDFAHFIGDTILDGELYVHGWRLQRINGAVATNRSAPRDDTHQVEFHVFDVVNPSLKFSERWLDTYNTLQQLPLEKIKVVPTAICDSRESVDQHFHHYTALGYEGIMLRPNGPYVYGKHLSQRTGTHTTKRSEYLWKYKQWEDGEFTCVGITQGEGKADVGIGAFRLSTNNEEPDRGDAVQFYVGTGFSDEERIEFMQNPPIGKKIKVRYLCLTDSGIPFNPSFLCVM